MTDEPEVVDGEVAGPDPELAEAVDEKLPDVSLAIKDPSDMHEVMLRMDDHDVALLLEEIQTKSLRRWVYKLPGNKGEGLTVHAVQDIVQRMNWTGKAKIGLLLDANGRPVLDIETIEVDEGDGTEPVWVATAYAKRRDHRVGAAGRVDGAAPDAQARRDTAVRPLLPTKAIQKATRNALAAFIPEEIEQAVLALALGQPDRVLRIQTEAEKRVAELPAPLDDEEARALIAEAEKAYAEIDGPGRVEFPPGKFGAYKLTAQHSHDRLRDLVAFVEGERDRLKAKYGEVLMAYRRWNASRDCGRGGSSSRASGCAAVDEDAVARQHRGAVDLRWALAYCPSADAAMRRRLNASPRGAVMAGYMLFINKERTVLVRWWRESGEMEVCTRPERDAIWGPPVQLELEPDR